MDIRIKLNYAFQPYADHRETIDVNGSTVKECLDSLISLFPILEKLLFDNSGALAALVLCDGETIVQNELNRPVKEQSELVILPMILGG